MIIKPNITSGLPAGYTEVEYIESSGTQYIDTGKNTFLNNVKIMIDFADDTVTTSESYFGNSGIRLVRNSALNNLKPLWNSDTKYGYVDIDLPKRQILYMDKNGLYDSNMTALASVTSNIGDTKNVLIFLSYYGSSGSSFDNKGSFKLYNFKMWDNNVLVRDFVPCIQSSDNVAGLYDTVNNVFYTNAGTGVFTTGAIIKDYEILKPKLGSTNIKNVYLGETRVYGVNQSQLVNYTMLYDAGDECIDITGGWTSKSFDLSYPAIGTLTKNTNNMYYSVSGSNTSGPATVNLLDVSKYKYFSTLQKFKANSKSWESATVGIGRNNKTVISNTIIGTNINVTVPKLYKTDISNTAENGCPFASINYTGNITLYYAMLFKQDNWQQLCTVAGLTPSTYTDEDNLCSNSSAMSTILNNQSAVNYMIRNCTGSFMGAFIASSTALSALNSSTYKTTIQANEHWAKFLAMVA